MMTDEQLKKLEDNIDKKWLFADCKQQIIDSGLSKEKVWEMVRDKVVSHEEVRSGILTVN